MIRHIVMWKFREGTEEKANEFLTKLAALDLASGEEISGLAFAPDGVSIIATVSGKSGERKVTVTREGSA